MESHAALSTPYTGPCEADAGPRSVNRRMPHGHEQILDTSAVVVADALDLAGVPIAAAARSLGVSRQRLHSKITSGHATVVDVLALIRAGGRMLDAAQEVVAELQRQIDETRGSSAPSPDLVPVLALAVGEASGSLLAAAAGPALRREVSRSDADDLRRRCASVHHRVNSIEAAIRGIR